MALDSSLFTLYFVPRSDFPSLTDLFSRPPSKEDSQIPNYTTSRWIKSATYKTSLLDGLSGSELGIVSGKNSTAKKKAIALFSPDASVELSDKRNAIVSMPIWKQEWQFAWQEEIFQITRESSSALDVEIIRKPDPPIKVAMYRSDGGGSSRDGHNSAFLQIMDYNIDRIENITDKKGLESVLVLAIASALDAQYDDKAKDPLGNMFLNPVAALHDEDDSVAPNEVLVLPQLHSTQLVDYCLHLLREGDERETGVSESHTCVTPRDLLRGTLKGQGRDLIVLKAQGQEMAQKALSVSERAKVGFYRLPQQAKGVLWDGSVPEELYQYVRTGLPRQQKDDLSRPEVQPQSAGTQASSAAQRARIKLGSPAQDTPRTPHNRHDSSVRAPASSEGSTSMLVYLSKSRLEEFEAEQAARIRTKMEEQSRLLAEKLEREERAQSGSPVPTAAAASGNARPSTPASQESPQGSGRLSRLINRMHG